MQNWDILDTDKSIRDQNALIWKNECHYKTSFYEKLDDETMRFIDYVHQHTYEKDSVLDMCCNQGRFLYELKRRGYSELYGFDIMEPAIEAFKENVEYDPNIMNIEHCLAQDYFNNKQDKQFDWAITYSATLELIHPEFNIFRELNRTVRKGMFLVINEKGHSYPRFWRFLHKKNGFKILHISKIQGDLSLIYSIKS